MTHIASKVRTFIIDYLSSLTPLQLNDLLSDLTLEIGGATKSLPDAPAGAYEDPDSTIWIVIRQDAAPSGITIYSIQRTWDDPGQTTKGTVRFKEWTLETIKKDPPDGPFYPLTNS